MSYTAHKCVPSKIANCLGSSYIHVHHVHVHVTKSGRPTLYLCLCVLLTLVFLKTVENSNNWVRQLIRLLKQGDIAYGIIVEMLVVLNCEL